MNLSIRDRKSGRLRAALVATTLCLGLQSCFTAGLWGSGMRDREKAALTPLSLALDAVTLPFQLAVLDGLGDHHHHGCR